MSSSSPSTSQVPSDPASQSFSPTSSSTATAHLTEAELAAAAELTVFDRNGNKVNFGSLYEYQKTIVVFVRHFFCGNCQQYVSQLTDVRPEALEQTATNIVIIGCGDWLLLNNYRDMTCQSNLPQISYYADPTRTVYRALGITTETLEWTPKGENKKSYLKTSLFSMTMISIGRALKNPLHIGKQGNFSQLGGEFVLGPGNICDFAHYMVHTEDHAEVADLFKHAGVPFP